MKTIHDSNLLETLADIEHERWSGWMRYLFTKGTQNDDGTFTIGAGSVRHWKGQMGVRYYDLPEPSKESDRKEVRQTLDAIDGYLKHEKLKH